MFFIFAYLGCLWLMVGIVSYYHNNNNTLYKMIDNRINNNLSITHPEALTLSNLNNKNIKIERFKLTYNIYRYQNI